MTSAGPNHPCVLVVDEGHPPDRLDKRVAADLDKTGHAAPRSAGERWIEDGRALVDGRAGRASQTVPSGARVAVNPAPPPPSRALPEPDIVLRVVYEDDALLVVD